MLIDYFAGATLPEAARLDHELRGKNVVLPPVVVTEILSDPTAGPEVIQAISGVPMLKPLAGYWQRAGRVRARIRMLRLRATLADALIAYHALITTRRC